MEVIYPLCAGLDVHKKTVVACVRRAQAAQVEQKVRSFPTTTPGLLRLRDWLEQEQCSHVAMESTGVYWKPVWHVLEGGFELVLGNAHHMRNVPGRKTDVNDAMWIADLLAHGLIRPSFVPPPAVQRLRDLTRTRTQLLRELSRHTQRLSKVLEDANIKLSDVVSDLLGGTGRAVLRALIAGPVSESELLELRHPRLKASPEEFLQALRGRVGDHHRFLLRLHWGQIESLESALGELEKQLEEQMRPFAAQLQRLATIPGLSETTARVLLAEAGPEMERFPTAGHLISWAGVSPGSCQSGSKRGPTHLRAGNRWLRTALVQAAWGSTRAKNSYLRARYYQLKGRRGGKRAVVAVAASILRSSYYMLQRAEDYREPQPTPQSERSRQRVIRRLTQRLEGLGVHVQIRPAA